MNNELVKKRKTLLEIEGLKKYFPVVQGFFKKEVGTVKAVDGVSFCIKEGETLGLVGESGCGKTTVGRLILHGYEPTDGAIRLNDDKGLIDIAALDRKALVRLYTRVQMVFQDPNSSLDPRMSVMEIISEPLRYLTDMSSAERQQEVTRLLEVVGLDPRYATRYPHAFSGGQRQRIGIARALALQPKLIVADEAVSALDVSVQAQVLNLMKDLQREYGIAYLFISHDLGVVENIAHNVAVMYIGRIVEIGKTEDVFRSPLHPYTEALLSAVPKLNEKKKKQGRILQGEVADPVNLPTGCPFYPRCIHAQAICQEAVPVLRSIGDEGHLTACHFAEELNLEGA